jgi:hypothetical protein
MSADQAIDAVYAAHGPRSPTAIINQLRDDMNDNNVPFPLR